MVVIALNAHVIVGKVAGKLIGPVVRLNILSVWPTLLVAARL